MKKKILSVILALSILLGVLPLSAFAAASDASSYSTGAGDSASYLLKVPTTSNGYTIKNQNGENFISFGSSLFENGTSVISSVSANAITYGSSASGVPSGIDLSNLSSMWIAFRIKIVDNSSAYEWQSSILDISFGNDTTKNRGLLSHTSPTMRWLDLNDGSMNRTTARAGIESAGGGIEFVGDMDGWVLVPASAEANITESFLRNNFSDIEIRIRQGYDPLGSNAMKESSWENKELLIGDVLLVEDIAKFQSVRAGNKIKYAPNDLADTAYYAVRTAGYKSQQHTTSGASTGKTIRGCETSYVGAGSPKRQYLHMTTLPNGDRAYAVSLNTDLGYSAGGASFSLINTYEQNWYSDATWGYRSGNIGIAPEIDLTKINALAFRIATADASSDNEEFTFTLQIRKSAASDDPRAIVCGNITASSVTYIDANTAEESTLAVAEDGSITSNKNLDGYIIVPTNAFGSFFGDKDSTDQDGEPNSSLYSTWGGSYNPSNVSPIDGTYLSEAYGVFLGSGFTNGKTFYAGDVFFVENADAFISYHTGCAVMGHDQNVTLKAVAPTCTETGLTEGKACSKCGKPQVAQQIIAAPGHSIVSKTIAPTTETEGYTEHVCTVCGYNYRDNYLNLLPSKTNKLGIGMFRFTGDTTNYTTDGTNTSQDKLDEIEDVLAAGYVNTMFIAVDSLFEERVALCRKYGCKFWTGPGFFYSDLQTIETYMANVEANVRIIQEAGAWDLFLGFNWDEPIWNGMSNEEFYIMTKSLYEKWGKRNFVVFCTGSFIDGYGEKYTTIDPDYMTYLTDASWDHYYYDLRPEAQNDSAQLAALASSNKKYGTNVTNAEEYYRWLHNEMMEKIPQDVNVWFFPTATQSVSTNASTSIDEGYWLAHLNFFDKLLKEQKYQGGLILYNYSGSVEKPALEQRLPILSLKTGEQRLFPEVEKYETYASRLKEIKVEYDKTIVLESNDFPVGTLDVTKKAAHFISYDVIEGFEYSIDGGKTYETDGKFENLTPETQYNIRVKRIGGDMFKDFSVCTAKEKPYASGNNDTASYAIKMPTDLNMYSTKYGHVGTGMGRTKDDSDFALSSASKYLHLKTIDGERFIEIRNNNTDANSVINLAFGDIGRATSKMGISSEVDTEKLTAFAFRVKTTGGSSDQLSIFDFYINQHRTTRTSVAPVLYIDKTSGAVTTMTYNHGLNVTGNIDGWVIIPFASYQAIDGSYSANNKSWIINNLKSFQPWLHEENCSNHGAESSSWDNDKRFYMGDVFYLESVDAFVEAHGAPKTPTATVCYDSIRVDVKENMLYSIDGGQTYVDNGSFTSLTPNTTYTVTVKNVVSGITAQTQFTTRSQHDYKETVKAPTCTDGGYTIFDCQICGYSYKGNEIEANGHSYVTLIKEPTCTEDGYTTYTCENCGDNYTADQTQKIEHSLVATQTVSPTYDADGYVLYECKHGCGYSEKEIIPQLVAPEIPIANIVSVTANSVTLNWQAYKNADKYFVEIIADGYRRCPSTSDTQLTYGGLAAETEYTVRICAKYGLYDYTEYGKAITFTTPKDETIRISATQEGSDIELTVNAPETAEMFWIYRLGENNSKTLLAATENNVCSVKAQLGENRFVATVRVKNGTAYSYVTTDAVTLNVNDGPIILSAKADIGVVELQISTISKADMFWIYKLSADGSKTLLAATSSEKYSLDAPVGKSTYVVTARISVDGKYKYVDSNAASAVVSASPITLTGEKTQSGIALNIQSELEADMFWIYRVNADGTTKLVAATANSTVTLPSDSDSNSFNVTVRAIVNGKYKYIKSETVTID